MNYFCRRVLTLVRAEVPEVELFIVGSDPPPAIYALEDIPGVHVTGAVPDIRPYMAGSSVYVVPLRLGVGIRGKILEAWAMTIPVVATTLACAGLRYRDGENLMVADTSKDFASRIVDLLKNRDLRERIGREGRKAAEQFYSWETVVSQLDQLYQRYIGPKHTAP
jgi:glycosyltransferase involved in cell wall biosynthesis